MKTSSLLFSLGLFIFLTSCKKEKATTTAQNLDEEKEILSQYFDAATSGIISAEETFHYLLKSPLTKDLDSNQLEGFITLSPAVEGKVVMANRSSISFQPNKPLQSNTTYEVTLNMPLLDAVQFTQKITYTVKTLEQQLKIEKRGFILQDDGYVEVVVDIKSSDVVNLSLLESCFGVKGAKKSFERIDKHHYIATFTFENLASANSNIEFEGSAIQSETETSLTPFVIPAESFEVVHDYHDKIGEELHIYFSKILKKGQDLTGLVTVGGNAVPLTVEQNVLKIFVEQLSGNVNELVISQGLMAKDGSKLAQDYHYSIENKVIVPAIDFVNAGNYFPSEGEFKIPVKARGLEFAKVMVIEIKQENVAHYLAWHSLENADYYSLRMYGKPIFEEVVPLREGLVDDDGFSVYGLDLTKQIKKNPGSIYHVSLDFLPEHTSLVCKSALTQYRVNYATPDNEYFYSKNGDFREEYMYYEDYSWEKNEDPCDISFYAYKQAAQKLLICSDYALIAKKAGSNYHVSVSKLGDLTPVSGADITLYDLQAETIGQGSTSGEGLAKIKGSENNGAVIKVSKGGQTTYLSLDEADSNPLTEYDISGEMSETDTEMFVYTDRDVWRPGDSIYVNVMFHEVNADLPKGLPLMCSFINTDGVQIQQLVKPLNLDSKLIYTFVLHTATTAKTGRYHCKIKYGTKSFRQNIQVETIKPNTTETILTFNNSENKVVYSPTLSGSIKTQYLTGFPAPKTKLNAVGKFYPLSNPFPDFGQYTFNIPMDKSDHENIPLFENVTGEGGEASFDIDYDFAQANSPGNLQIEIESVLDGGGANKEGKSVKISPFDSYVGAERKLGSGWAGNHTFNENIDINLIRLDKKGKISNGSKSVQYTLYRHLDQWWIDKYRLQHWGNFRNENYWAYVREDAIDINGKGVLRLPKGSLKKGAYKVVFTDENSGHQSAVFFTVYDGVERIPAKEAHLLELMTEKDEYKAGENIVLRLPDIAGAKALVSVERGKEIIQQSWHDVKASANIVKIKADESWTPNIYVHVTILQPYKKLNNDLPLRMYGVKSIKLSGVKKPLLPVTDIPLVMESEKSYTFSVSEKEGRPMEYTVALVDEGLLNLKGFKTPDPHGHFNGKYPLLVKTWDIYKYLMTFFSGQFAGIISIGGDDAYKADALQEVNRFPPVVFHMGSFRLDAKASKKHTIKIPRYIGKLRLMVVACNQQTFGSLEKMVTVKNPVMVQTRFPRSLNVTDKIRLPIQVFKDDVAITSAVLNAKVSNPIIKGLPSGKSVEFGKDNMSTVYVNAEVLNKPGTTKIDMTIQGNGKSMTEKTELTVQYPNAYASDGEISVIKPGASATFVISPKGYADVFKGKFIVSGMLAPDFITFSERLIEYPYGCLEQTTSAGFGQLFLGKLLDLDPAIEQQRQQFLKAAVSKISSLQRGGGSFNYWDSDYYHAWSDMYAGHFLLEMKNLGYLPGDNEVFQNWLNFSYQRANTWTFTGANSEYYYDSECLMHAYRLYVLAKANRPAKSAMNRFMSTCTSKNPIVWWLLAGSFIQSGFDSKAKEMMTKAENLQLQFVEKYGSYYFQSKARDLAMIVEILAGLPSEKAKMDRYFIEMVQVYNSNDWHSTHDMGYACLATYAYYGTNPGLNKDVEYKISGLASILNYKHKPSVHKTIPVDKGYWNKKIEIRNSGKADLYVNKSIRFISDNLNLPAEQKEVKMSVQYYNNTRKKAGLASCTLGDDIFITVEIKNTNTTSLRNMALNVTMPSGLELINPRLYQTDVINTGSDFEYQDFKDDRVYTFFSLDGGKTKTYYFKAKAAFTGDFYQPRIVCENMYRGNITAKTPSGRVVITQ